MSSDPSSLSSLAYWSSRWAQAPMAFATSWPDEFARRLELIYVNAKLPLEGHVVEIGCGNFGLAEEPRITTMLRDRYTGVDGAPEALEAAQRRTGSGFEFVLGDITKDQLPPGDFLLSKRVIQNVAPGPGRAELLLRLRGLYAHGLLIEDWVKARARTDEDRHRFGREPLTIPDFNWPLTTEELHQARIFEYDPFMGYFYAITRVFANLPRSGFEAAFALSQTAILHGEGQPLRGPVVALSW